MSSFHMTSGEVGIAGNEGHGLLDTFLLFEGKGGWTSGVTYDNKKPLKRKGLPFSDIFQGYRCSDVP